MLLPRYQNKNNENESRARDLFLPFKSIFLPGTEHIISH